MGGWVGWGWGRGREGPGLRWQEVQGGPNNTDSPNRDVPCDLPPAGARIQLFARPIRSDVARLSTITPCWFTCLVCPLQLLSLATSLTPAIRTGPWHNSRRLGYVIRKPPSSPFTLSRWNEGQLACRAPRPAALALYIPSRRGLGHRQSPGRAVRRRRRLHRRPGTFPVT